VSVDAPSTLTRKTGSNAWTISDEMSMNMLTKPSAQMLRGNLALRVERAVGGSLAILCLALLGGERREISTY